MQPRNVSLLPAISYIEPMLRQNYGLAGEWREIDSYTGKYGIVTSRQTILGDEEEGVWLKHSIHITTDNDGYSGDGGSETLWSHGLLHKTSGGKLEISITIDCLLFTNDEIEFVFEGEEDDVEKLKEYVRNSLGFSLNLPNTIQNA